MVHIGCIKQECGDKRGAYARINKYMHMYICIYIYIFIYIYMYIYTFNACCTVHICIHQDRIVCGEREKRWGGEHTYAYIIYNIYIYYIYIYIFMYMNFIHICTCIYTHIYIYTHIHTHIYAYTHTYIAHPTCFFSPGCLGSPLLQLPVCYCKRAYT